MKSDIFKDATIVAPDERVYFSESGEIGTYKAKYANEHGEYKRDSSGTIKSKTKSYNYTFVGSNLCGENELILNSDSTFSLSLDGAVVINKCKGR